MAKNWSDKIINFFNQSAVSLPMVIFGVLAVAVLAASTLYQDNLQRSIQASVNRLSEESQVKTSARLEAYQLLARSGIGLLRANQPPNEITNQNWNQHLQAMKLDENYPSIVAFGYGDVGEFERSPVESIALRYIYPSGTSADNAVGRNIADVTDNIQKTVDTAARTGQPRLAQAQPAARQSSSGRPSYLFYLITPVYETDEIPTTEQDRFEQLEGVIFVVADTNTLFNLVYRQQDPALRRLSVSQEIDGQSQVLYSRGARLEPENDNNVVRQQRKLEIMGQTLAYNYEFSKNSLIPPAQRYLAVAMPFVGLILALLLALVMSSTLRFRNTRLTLAKEREVQAAKDELLSLASHQLRTPATGVKQYLGMITQGFAGEVSDTQRDFLERAYESNERQLNIINDILYLAKLDAGRIVLTKTKYNFAAQVRSVVEELKESARDAEVSIECQIPEKVGILADEHMTRIIIENLLTNAIKYTNPGGEINLKLERKGENIWLAVKDNGVGIASEDLSKLFKQFSRVVNERSSQVSGTGVGLYLAKNLAVMHDGDIRVRSKPGKGTIFTVVLPRGL